MSSPSLNINASVVGQVTSPSGIGSAVQNVNLTFLEQLLAGTGSGQCDTIYEETTTLAASGTVTRALTGGGLTDPFGNAVAFLHVKALVLIVDPTSAGDIIVGNAASNGWQGPFGALTHTIQASPGEAIILTKGQGAAAQAGWPVTASTAMNLKIANASGSGSSKYQLLMLGTST